MINFESYLNHTFKEYPQTANLESFKRHMARKMQNRAKEIYESGLQDEKVLYDLVVDLYSDLDARFQKQNPIIYSGGSLWNMTSKRGIYGV